MRTTTLLKDKTTTGSGPAAEQQSDMPTFQAVVAGTGAVSATVYIEATLNDTDWVQLGSIVLSGTTRATDGFVNAGNWAAIRANVNAVSGTGAAVSVYMGGK